MKRSKCVEEADRSYIEDVPRTPLTQHVDKDEDRARRLKGRNRQHQ